MLVWLGVLIFATGLFGLAVAIVGNGGVGGVGGLLSIMVGISLALCTVGLARSNQGKVPLKPLLIISACNLVQLGLYLLALQLAPIGIAAALHLTSPVWLLLWACLRRQRSWSISTIGILLLIAGGIGLAIASVEATDSSKLGLLLALMSAWVLAIMWTMVKKYIHQLSKDWSQGVCQGLGAGVLLPIMLVSGGDWSWIGFGVGVLLFAPGGLMVWWAIGKVTPSLVGATGLLEAPFAALAAALLFSNTFTITQALAMTLLLGAACWEARVTPLEAQGARALEY
jgi:drug/metabolite transporter (DMT)-like permease